MIENKTRRVVLGGLFAAFGVILPWFTSHAFGIAGIILLPMHIPVLLCGFLCGPLYGAACGIAVPVLSSLLTNMPAMYPMLPIMAAQLFVTGLAGGFLYGKLKLKIYISLPVSMICGWAVYGLAYSVLLLADSKLQALSAAAAIIRGVPGIVIQLVLIPAVIIAVKKYINRTVKPD